MEEHISSVLEIGLKFAQNIENKILKDVISIILFSHDLGKSTSYFQRYIQGDKSVDKSLKNHSLLGAVISLYLTDRYLKSQEVNDKFLLILSYILPKRHHSDLEDFMYDITLDDSEIETLEKQIKSINKDKFKKFLENLKFENKDIFLFDFDEINLEQIQKLLRDLKTFVRKEIREKQDLEYYIKTLLFYSLLLDADKSEVGIKTDKKILFKHQDIKPSIVDNYLKNLNKQSNLLYKLREKAYNEIEKQEIDLNQKIYILNLPTGMGKTLLSFKFALKIADKFKQEKGKDLRIVYVLPFLSIIEQNHKVIENVLKHNNIKVDNSILLKFHHLTGFKYENEEQTLDYDSSRILIEGFNSKIIVTTFMQFFYSILGNKNKMLRKFHKFTNAVIILDEVQNIPTRYWLLIKQILNSLTENFDLYVIYTTATLPDVFISGKNLLLQKNYFDQVNRYKIKIDLTPKTIRDFCNSLQIQDDKSYLFILNTVPSAEEVYNFLKEKYPEEVIYLSTHVVPKERLERIELLKAKKKRIAVSTQLVEAGVDIDFDVVYRDFAPLDSIIQSAGRCNREALKEMGVLYLINLYDEKTKRNYSSYIYDVVLLLATQEVLTKSVYEEKEIQEIVNEYYQNINQRISKSESTDLIKLASGLVFSSEKERNKIKSVRDFILIEEDNYKQDVFIQLEEKAVETWNKFKEIWNIEDVFERKKAFDIIKKDFYEYVVSVPIKDNYPYQENYFYYVPLSELEKYYDRETGFKVKGDLFFEY
jgi:CRISPR-associated endonuclease/helicase Cas3